MQVYLSEALFEDSYDEHLGLTGLFDLARNGRHQFRLQPSFCLDDRRGLPRQRWLAQQHPGIRHKLERVLESSARDASVVDPTTMAITVTAAIRSDWKTLELTLDDARALLSKPLRVMVENRNSDWNFVRAVVPPQRRVELDDARRRGWLEVDGPGGIDELKKDIEHWKERIDTDPSALAVVRRRVWVMFDRDVEPGEPLNPSPSSKRLRELCTALRLPHQPLARRTIENYLPGEALSGPHLPSKDSHRARLPALHKLRGQYPACAFSLNLKEGLIKDSTLNKNNRHSFQQRWARAQDAGERQALCTELEDTLPATWRNLPTDLRADLLVGFGECAERFKICDTEPRWETWFQTEYDRGPEAQPSRDAFASSLMALI